MAKELYNFTIDDYERRFIIHALNELRNQQLAQDKNTDVVNELLLKYIDKEPKSKNRYEAR